MADSNVAITQGSGTDIDTRTEATNGHHRQVVVIGDPSTNAGVAPVDATAGVKVDLGADNDVTVTGEVDVRRVHNVVDGTISIGNRPDIGRVHNVVDGTISIGNRPDIGRVHNLVDGTVSIGRPDIQRVHNVVDGTISIGNFSGIGATASIFSVSGSSAAAQTAGITVIAPSSAYNFKIFAYSIQTTGVLASALTFANGNSASQTEFYRPLVAKGGSGTSDGTPFGANMAVSPPGYLFATGTNTTLVIAGNNGSTIHYSVSYIKESA